MVSFYSKTRPTLIEVITHNAYLDYPYLCSHLQVDIFDPFDDPMRRPHQRIHVLVLTLDPASLQCLKTNEFDPILHMCKG